MSISLIDLARSLGMDTSSRLDMNTLDNLHQDRELLRRLIETRRTLELSQEDVAERMGVSQSAVAKFESLTRDPRLSTIQRYMIAVEAAVEHRLNGRPVVSSRMRPELDYRTRTDVYIGLGEPPSNVYDLHLFRSMKLKTSRGTVTQIDDGHGPATLAR